MKIQTSQNNLTNFKSGFPVVHWVREAGGRFSPAVTPELNEALQRTVVRMLNADVRKAKTSNMPIIKKIKDLLFQRDDDFRRNSYARSFYNRSGGWQGGRFEPFGYIFTGHHAEHMSEKFGKAIGKTKSHAPRIGERLADTAEVNIAVTDYLRQGLILAKRLSSLFRNGSNVREVLHTKFEVVRSKTNRIKGFRFLDAKFCPAEGAGSPISMWIERNK